MVFGRLIGCPTRSTVGEVGRFLQISLLVALGSVLVIAGSAKEDYESSQNAHSIRMLPSNVLVILPFDFVNHDLSSTESLSFKEVASFDSGRLEEITESTNSQFPRARVVVGHGYSTRTSPGANWPHKGVAIDEIATVIEDSEEVRSIFGPDLHPQAVDPPEWAIRLGVPATAQLTRPTYSASQLRNSRSKVREAVASWIHPSLGLLDRAGIESLQASTQDLGAGVIYLVNDKPITAAEASRLFSLLGKDAPDLVVLSEDGWVAPTDDSGIDALPLAHPLSTELVATTGFQRLLTVGALAAALLLLRLYCWWRRGDQRIAIDPKEQASKLSQAFLVGLIAGALACLIVEAFGRWRYPENAYPVAIPFGWLLALYVTTLGAGYGLIRPSTPKAGADPTSESLSVSAKP